MISLQDWYQTMAASYLSKVTSSYNNSPVIYISLWEKVEHIMLSELSPTKKSYIDQLIWHSMKDKTLETELESVLSGTVSEGR